MNIQAMNPLNWNFRKLYLLGAAVCFTSVGYALYVQYHMFMMPCPLCIFQRIAFVAMGIFFLLGAIHNPQSTTGRKSYAALTLLPGVVGLMIAGRHVQIQLMPSDQAPLCNSLGLDYMLDAMPLKEVLVTVFKGSGECAKIDWTFLGFSMPMWTSALYLVLIVLAVFAAFKHSPKK